MHPPLVAEAFLAYGADVELGHKYALGLIVHTLLLDLQVFRVEEALEDLHASALVDVALQTDLEEVLYATDRHAVRQRFKGLERVDLGRVLFQELERRLQVGLGSALLLSTGRIDQRQLGLARVRLQQLPHQRHIHLLRAILLLTLLLRGQTCKQANFINKF